MVVYYSTNSREQVTDEEITMFVNQYSPTMCWIPETVYYRVFEIAKQLRLLNVWVVAIPNIEIVRRQELLLHHSFDTILYNNHFCQNVFKQYGYHGDGKYIGFGLNPIDELIPMRPKQLTFLCLGGLNAFIRKNVDQVTKAFLAAKLPNASLIVTIQSISAEGMKRMPPSHPSVVVISRSLTSKEINDLYNRAHCLIQVSRHEGLGIGFYEGLQHGLPGITLNISPHNEVYTKATAWLIPATLHPPKENPDSFIFEAEFKTSDLSQSITHCYQAFQDNTKGQKDMNTATEVNGKTVNRIVGHEGKEPVTDYNGMKPMGFDDWLEWYMENEQVVSTMFMNRSGCIRKNVLNTLKALYQSVGLKKFSETHMALTGLLFCRSDETFFPPRSTSTVEKMAGCTLVQFFDWSSVHPLDSDAWSMLEESVKAMCDDARKCEFNLGKYRLVLDAVQEAQKSTQ